MMKLIFSAAVLGLVAMGTTTYMQQKIVEQAETEHGGPETSTYKKVVVKKTSSQEVTGRVARIKMDNRGHFVTDAKMNGRKIEVLVDTGATSVALDEQTARRLGIRLKPSDYKYEVSTANGKVMAASAMIDKVQIGRVTVRNVRAAVLQGKGLGGTLLGMSFLGQLKEFKVADGHLIMRQ